MNNPPVVLFTFAHADTDTLPVDAIDGPGAVTYELEPLNAAELASGNTPAPPRVTALYVPAPVLTRSEEHTSELQSQ